MQFCATKKSDKDFWKKGKFDHVCCTVYSLVCTDTTSAKFDVKIILNKVNKRKHSKTCFFYVQNYLICLCVRAGNS